VSIETLVFALALSSRIRLLNRQQQELTLRARTLEVASATDPLTGVLNRAGFSTQAQELLVNERRRTLVMIDLDKFKPINDHYGHAAGDATLVEVARRLRAQVRPGDLVARLGGDEFALLFSEPNDKETLTAICQRLLGAISHPIDYQGQTFSVGLSMGLASHPEDGKDLATLLHAADMALYQVKRSGRGNFAFFDQLTGLQQS